MLCDLLEDIRLWRILCFGIGLAIYFKFQIDLAYIAISLITLYGVSKYFYRFSGAFYCLFLVPFGYIYAHTYSFLQQHNTIEEKTYSLITGRIESLEITNTGHRILLKSVKGDNLLEELPYVRITTRMNVEHLSVGNYVELKALISPPFYPAYSNSYDFNFTSFFNSLAATGYALSSIDILEDLSKVAYINSSFYDEFKVYIHDIRYRVARNFIETYGKTIGGISAALTVGMKKAIPHDVMETIRISGIAHLLAISGMHIVSISAIVFFLTFGILKYFPRILLNYNPFRIAALSAIFITTLYALLSGFSISTQRAYIMTLVFLVSILLNRRLHLLRSIYLAIALILILSPYNVILPGFQMSSMATLMLIVVFSNIRQISFWNMQNRPINYICSLILSSMVATTATTPLVLYHFNQYTSYGVLTNILAVPITTVLLLPILLFVTLFYILFGILLNLGFDIIIKFILSFAEFVASFSVNSFVHIFSEYQIFILILFMTILSSAIHKFYMKDKVNLYRKQLVFLIMIFITTYFSFYIFMKKAPKPSILISNSLIALEYHEDTYRFSSYSKNKFVSLIWRQKLGQNEKYSTIFEEIENSSKFQNRDKSVEEGEYIPQNNLLDIDSNLEQDSYSNPNPDPNPDQYDLQYRKQYLIEYAKLDNEILGITYNMSKNKKILILENVYTSRKSRFDLYRKLNPSCQEYFYIISKFPLYGIDSSCQIIPHSLATTMVYKNGDMKSTHYDRLW